MKQSKKKKRLSQKTLVMDNSLLDSIVNSQQLSQKEKISFLKYVGYFTPGERKQLIGLI